MSHVLPYVAVLPKAGRLLGEDRQVSASRNPCKPRASMKSQHIAQKRSLLPRTL